MAGGTWGCSVAGARTRRGIRTEAVNGRIHSPRFPGALPTAAPSHSAWSVFSALLTWEVASAESSRWPPRHHEWPFCVMKVPSQVMKAGSRSWSSRGAAAPEPPEVPQAFGCRRSPEAQTMDDSRASHRVRPSLSTQPEEVVVVAAEFVGRSRARSIGTAVSTARRLGQRRP